jgi:tRNA threonylcarbamoyladenosine biosynthesis protein TsaE
MIEEDPEEGIWKVITKSPDQTLRLGHVFGRMLPQASMVALIGDLGSGKTLLAKGIAKGLGVEDEREVSSPTFVLVNEYRGPIPVHHVDLYRLQDSVEVEDIGWEEFISGPGVTLVEWAEKVPDLLPEDRIEVYLHWVGAGERKLVFVGKGQAARGLVNHLRKKWVGEA